MLGFVGLGHMGGPIAERIASTAPLVAFDVRRGAVDAVVASGAHAASSLHELAASADDIFVCVNTEDQLVGVVNEIVSAATSPKTLIVLSTVPPEAVLRLCQRLEPMDWTVVDCPVSGNMEARATGGLTVFLGHRDPMNDDVQRAIGSFAGTVNECGAPGAGQAAKLVNNILALVGLLASAEAIRFGAAYGLSLDTVQKVAASATGDCYAMRNIDYYQNFKAAHPLGDDDEAFFAFMTKDLRTAWASAADHGVALPFTRAAADTAPAVYEEFWNE